MIYVQVLFDWGTDPFRSRQLVNERLQVVQSQLPDGVIPVMAPMSSATGLIMHTGVTGGAKVLRWIKTEKTGGTHVSGHSRSVNKGVLCADSLRRL